MTNYRRQFAECEYFEVTENMLDKTVPMPDLDGLTISWKTGKPVLVFDIQVSVTNTAHLPLGCWVLRDIDSGNFMVDYLPEEEGFQDFRPVPEAPGKLKHVYGTIEVFRYQSAMYEKKEPLPTGFPVYWENVNPDWEGKKPDIRPKLKDGRDNGMSYILSPGCFIGRSLEYPDRFIVFWKKSDLITDFKLVTA